MFIILTIKIWLKLYHHQNQPTEDALKKKLSKYLLGHHFLKA